MKNSQVARLTLLAMAILFLVGAPVLGYKGAMEIWSCIQAQSWPTVDGTITRSGLRTERTRRIGKPASETYDANIIYEYVVKGRKYNSERLTFAGINRSSRSAAEEYLARFPQGGTAKVHYDPASPSDAVLDTAQSFWSWLLVAIGVVLPVVGVLMLRWLKSAPPPAADPPAIVATT